MQLNKSVRGMTLIDAIVGVFIMLLVFLSLFGAFRLSIELVYNAKAKTGAVALITEQMEYIRALPYDSVGTSGGIPAGSIPQTQTKKLNNIIYTIRTLIQYIDAPEDGLGALDTNAITSDYKSVKIEVLWTTRERPRNTFAVTRVSPHGIESIGTGGTLRVNVFNALAAPVAGASVRIQNAATVPPVDVTVATDNAGTVMLPGTPPAAGYSISVTKNGYSSSTTYAPTAQNPNPNPGNVAVANNQTTTASFGVDLLSSLTVRTFSPIGAGSFADPFDNDGLLSATSSTIISSGELLLESDAGTYVSAGSATSSAIAPAYLASWQNLAWSAGTPPGSVLAIRLYYLNAGSYALIPDVVIAGNSSGITTSPIDLSSLSTTTYGTLKISASLSGDTTVTPTLSAWTLSYLGGPTPLPDVDFSIHGAKIIGTSGGGTPIYKYMGLYTTSSSAEKLFSTIEWDSYTLGVASYDILERCPFAVSVAPNEQKNASLTLGNQTTNSLLVYVTGNSLTVGNADVSITGGATQNKSSSACGQAYFGALPGATYTVSVTATGFQAFSDSVAVSGATEFVVNLTPQ